MTQRQDDGGDDVTQIPDGVQLPDEGSDEQIPTTREGDGTSPGEIPDGIRVIGLPDTPAGIVSTPPALVLSGEPGWSCEEALPCHIEHTIETVRLVVVVRERRATHPGRPLDPDRVEARLSRQIDGRPVAPGSKESEPSSGALHITYPAVEEGWYTIYTALRSASDGEHIDARVRTIQVVRSATGPRGLEELRPTLPAWEGAFAEEDLGDQHTYWHHQQLGGPRRGSATLWEARWDRPRTHDGVTAWMQVDAPGLTAGEAMCFLVFQDGYGLIAQVPATASADYVEAPFSGWHVPKAAVDHGDVTPRGGFPEVRFRFTVVGARHEVAGPAILYGDALDVALKILIEGDEADSAELPYVVYSPWGTLDGTTTKDGCARQEGLPPGGVLIGFLGRVLTFGDNR